MTSEQTVPLRVLDPGHVEIHCSCGNKPVSEINVMSLTDRRQLSCPCGRTYTVRSTLAGISATLES